MRRVILGILSGTALVFVIFVGFLYTNHDIGVPAGSLKHDLRTSQRTGGSRERL